MMQKAHLHTITNLRALKPLLLLLVLCSMSTQVWAWRGAKLHLYSQPSDYGYVYVNTSNSGSASNKTYDYASQSEDKLGKTTYYFYMFNAPKTGYKFMGYSADKNATSGTASNSVGIQCNTAWWGVYAEVTYYAIFAPIDYSIRFNGNGSTGGSMSNLSMTYATSKNLTANAFKREYTVTYDANGGSCATTSAKATYTFANWATQANGTGTTYADKASVNNITTTDGAVVDLYAQWNSASVTLPSATKAGCVLDGWYNGDTKVGEAGASYTPKSNVTLKAKWIDKYTPVMTGGDQSIMVDAQQLSAFTFEHVDGQQAHITVKSISAVTNGDGKVIEYDAANNKIIAHNAGVAEIYFTQAETSTIKEGTSATYTYTVYKYNSVFSNVADFDNVLVDASTSASNYALNYVKPQNGYIGNVISSPAGTPTLGEASGNFYYTLSQNVTTDNTIGSPDGSIAITYNASSKVATAKNQGVGTVSLYQKETYKYNSANTSFDVTVVKHEPVFTWNKDNTPYYYQSTINNIFRTTNGDTDTTVVSDNPYSSNVIDNALHIYNVEESATYTVRQEENYKWAAKETKITVTPVEQNNHVPFTVTNGNKSNFVISAENCAVWNDDNGYRMGDNKWILGNAPESYIIIRFTGIPDKLTFNFTCDESCLGLICSYPLANNYYFKVYESDTQEGLASAGAVWENTPSKNYSDLSDGEKNIEVQLNPTTRYLKLYYYGTCYGHFRNINVTELNKFVADKETIDFGTQGEKYGTQMETVNFSHANAGRTTTVSIEGTDAAFFTVKPEVIPETGRDLTGKQTCRVTFDNKDDRRSTPYSAELVFSDNLGHEKRVPLTGIRFGKRRPEYTWNPNHLPYYLNSQIAHVAISTNDDYANCPLSYETTDASIAYVDASGTLQIGKVAGSVTITVRQTNENDGYLTGSAEFPFTTRERPSLATPFQVNSAIYYSSIEAGNKCYWENSDGGRVRSGNKNIFIDDLIWETDEKVFTLAFSGAPDKLSFEFRNNDAGILINSTKPKDYHMWEVQESADGAIWHTVWYRDSQIKEWTTVSDLQLDTATQFIKFIYWGNYEGYWRNINVTSYDGYKFLRDEESNQYLSRGAEWGTRAVVDAFGIAARVTRSTPDNENYYAKFQFVDNEQYMFEDGSNQIYTDDNGRTTTRWKVTTANNLTKIQSANGTSHDGYYITITNGVLTLTNNAANATQWYMESNTEHSTNITHILDAQAAAAAQYDFAGITTLAGMRTELRNHSYEYNNVTIPLLNVTEQTGEYRTSAGANAVYDNVITTLTPGFYVLTVKAFSRGASADVAYDLFDRKLESVVAYVYANNVKFPIKSLFDETGRRRLPFTEGAGRQYANEYYYADDLTAASHSFAADEYEYLNDVYVYVPADEGKETGTLRYGIVNPSYVDGAWMVYGDITLKRLDRAQYIFQGDVDGDKENWQENENWDRGDKPNEDNAVIIRSDVTIAEEVSVYSVTIENNAKVTIAPTGGLTVGKGGVKGATTENLLLKAGTKDEVKGQTGFLRVDPACELEMPQATVELFSIGYHNQNNASGNKSKYQCVGVPISEEGVEARTVFPAGSWVYTWNESTESWVNSRTKLKFQKFKGFETTQKLEPNGKLYTYTGKLVSAQNEHKTDWEISDLSCTKSGYNLLANSFAAPISISSFIEDDFRDVDMTIYILNAGTQEEATNAEDYDSPGKWVDVPIYTAEQLEGMGRPRIIPSMQGFWVKAKSNEAKLTLNYSRLVWEVSYSGAQAAKPLRTPKRSLQSSDEQKSTPIRGRLKVSVKTDTESDHLCMLESEQYAASYEDGYDSYKMQSDGVNVFAICDSDQFGVDATNSIIGTHIGVRTSDTTAYTMKFSHLQSENDLALLDTETNLTTDIDEGTEYTFYAAPNSEILGRFQIVERAVAPSTPTGIEGAESEVKVHKFIKDNQLYILKNGVLYNGTGAVVR